MENKNVWGILEFKKQTGIEHHHNTLDLWFKKLEEKGLHYVNRIVETGEKVYDELDVDIARHIYLRRQEKWSLDGIFSSLPNYFELRPFPVNEPQGNNESQVVSLESLKKEIMQAFNDMLNDKIEEITQILPQPINKQEERQRRITDLITNRKIEYRLRTEAVEKWRQMPEGERMIKVGWFKKVENTEGKERFIAEYINQHFEEKLKQEYDL